MSHPSAKNIAVKLYLDPDAFLDFKAKCNSSGLSMSTGGGLAVRQWEPAHRIRRAAVGDMPKAGLKRALSLPGSRRGGAPVPHLRV